MYKMPLYQIILELKRGKVVALPTDTIPGIICKAKNSAAIRKIYQLKQRPINMPFIILYSNINLLYKDIIYNPTIKKLSDAFWPNNLTIIAYKNPKSSMSNLIAKDNKIAVRYIKHKFLSQIIKKIGPVASTSLNIHKHIDQHDFNIPCFGDLTKINACSSIYDSTNNSIIREGQISATEIYKALER